METVTIVIIAVASLGLAIGAFILGSKRKRPDDSLLLIQQGVENVREQLRASLEGTTNTVNKQMTDLMKLMETQLHRHTGNLNDTRQAMDKRLDNAATVIGEVQKTMGRLHEALVPVGELRDILKAPKMRGGFGEVMLEQLLEEMLPTNMFHLQYPLCKGDRVDAVVKVGGHFVAIDSKFPLEKYREYLAADSDESRKAAKKGLVSAVKKHADDITKYINPDEGTYPFALMYIPSESIFYELFVSNDSGDAVWSHMANRRVFPVSSNTLYMYLQTISFGLKGMRIAEHAKEVLNRLEQLSKNIGDIKKNYDVLGKHLKNAAGAYKETEEKMGKLEVNIASINTDAVPALAEPARTEDSSQVQ